MLRRVGVVGGLLLYLLLTLVGASALPHAPHKPPVTAVDARTGKQLPPNPLVQHGSQVVLTVPGFAPRTQVVVALVGARHLGTVRAGRRGVVRYPFTVPRRLRHGHHILIFSGPAPASVYRRRPPKTVHPLPRWDPQTIMVAVPYDPPWSFRTGPPPRTRPPGDPEHRTQGGAAGPPAETGIDLLLLAVVGPVAIILGAFVFAAGRRRRRGQVRT
jgi:hypothetical protein